VTNVYNENDVIVCGLFKR